MQRQLIYITYMIYINFTALSGCSCSNLSPKLGCWELMYAIWNCHASQFISVKGNTCTHFELHWPLKPWNSSCSFSQLSSFYYYTNNHTSQQQKQGTAFYNKITKYICLECTIITSHCTVRAQIKLTLKEFLKAFSKFSAHQYLKQPHEKAY